MPKVETWGDLPPGVRQHLIERMRDRAISIADLNDLRLWIDTQLVWSPNGVGGFVVSDGSRAIRRLFTAASLFDLCTDGGRLTRREIFDTSRCCLRASLTSC